MFFIDEIKAMLRRLTSGVKGLGKSGLAAMVAMVALTAAACGGAAAPTQTAAPAETTAPTTAAPATTAAPVAEEKVEAPAEEETAERAPQLSVEDAGDSIVRLEMRGSYVWTGDVNSSTGDWSGTAVIINEQGHAITNFNSVGGAATINASGGRVNGSVSARVLGVSECANLALIDLDGDGWPALQVRSEPISAGLSVFSAGYPDGFSYSVTSGVVSTAATDIADPTSSVNTVIQHDARTQSGAGIGGGPLVDDQARVVAINHYTDSSTDQNYAVSADEISKLIAAVEAGQPESFGINGYAYNHNSEDGVWVLAVDSGSAADKAGLQAGDLILKMEGIAVGTGSTLETYCDVIASNSPTDVLDIEVRRPATGALLVGELNGDELKDPSAATTTTTTAATPAAPYTAVTIGSVTVELPTAWVDTKSIDTGWGFEAAANLSNLGSSPSALVNDNPPADGATHADLLNHVWSLETCSSVATTGTVSTSDFDFEYEEWAGCTGPTVFVASGESVAWPGDFMSVRVYDDKDAFMKILNTMTW